MDTQINLWGIVFIVVVALAAFGLGILFGVGLEAEAMTKAVGGVCKVAPEAGTNV